MFAVKLAKLPLLLFSACTPGINRITASHCSSCATFRQCRACAGWKDAPHWDHLGTHGASPAQICFSHSKGKLPAMGDFPFSVAPE